MRVILIFGQPGTGKTTLGKALSADIKNSAYIDTDALIAVNPFEPLQLDSLLRENILTLTNNFVRAGYQTIIISGGVRDQKTLDGLTSQLPGDAIISLIELRASEAVRRERKEDRARDGADSAKHFEFVDQLYPVMESLEIRHTRGGMIVIDTSIKNPHEVFEAATTMLHDD